MQYPTNAQGYSSARDTTNTPTEPAVHIARRKLAFFPVRCEPAYAEMAAVHRLPPVSTDQSKPVKLLCGFQSRMQIRPRRGRAILNAHVAVDELCKELEYRWDPGGTAAELCAAGSCSWHLFEWLLFVRWTLCPGCAGYWSAGALPTVDCRREINCRSPSERGPTAQIGAAAVVEPGQRKVITGRRLKGRL